MATRGYFAADRDQEQGCEAENKETNARQNTKWEEKAAEDQALEARRKKEQGAI